MDSRSLASFGSPRSPVFGDCSFRIVVRSRKDFVLGVILKVYWPRFYGKYHTPISSEDLCDKSIVLLGNLSCSANGESSNVNYRGSARRPKLYVACLVHYPRYATLYLLESVGLTFPLLQALVRAVVNVPMNFSSARMHAVMHGAAVAAIITKEASVIFEASLRNSPLHPGSNLSIYTSNCSMGTVLSEPV